MSAKHTREEVLRALNRAADDVLEASEAPDEGKRDVANLIVNAAAHYLDHPNATLAEAIRAEYGGESPDKVIEWCHS